jgi:hypothetical protein
MSDQTQQSAQPEYLGQFCPILSHAVLRPSDLKTAADGRQMILPVGGDIASAAKAAADEPGEAEYIGCQGPSCAFFLRSEGKCCIPLLTQAAGVLISMQLGAKIEVQQPPQH